jgi:DNA-binding NarL/FixJ family response regulator
LPVIDDNRLVREGLTAMLNKLPDFHAIAYADINAAMAAGRSPSVLLLDMGLGDVESARVVTALVQQMPETRIVAMDLMPLSEEILELINAGVSGIVMKDSSFDEFAANLRAVAGGAKVAPPRATETLVAQIAKEARARKAQDVLEGVRMTPRELEVIELIGKGSATRRSRNGSTSRRTPSRVTCATSWRSSRCTRVSKSPLTRGADRRPPARASVPLPRGTP